jgi:uncharacterized protein YbjT (DUF2867 family)
VESATLARPCSFLQRHLATVKDSVLRDGVIHIPGGGSVKQPYIAVDDVAHLIVASIGHKAAFRRVLDITGPVALSPEEVAQLHERILGRMLKRKYTPAAIFKMLSVVLKPFSPRRRTSWRSSIGASPCPRRCGGRRSRRNWAWR